MKNKFWYLYKNYTNHVLYADLDLIKTSEETIGKKKFKKINRLEKCLQTTKIWSDNGFIGKLVSKWRPYDEKDLPTSRFVVYMKNGYFNKLNGPAIVQLYFSKHSEGKLFSRKLWIMKGKLLHVEYILGRDNTGEQYNREYPIYEGDKIVNGVELNRQTIMKAMLDNRKYGLFLMEKLNEG